MLKNFLLKKLIKSKMKNLPEAEQEKIFKLVSENPELFKKITDEAQGKIDSGQDQMAAFQEVMVKYKDEIQQAMES